MLKYRWGFIVGISLLSLYFIIFKKMQLGLDLKGGIHLVIRVQSEDAVKAELDQAVQRVGVDLTAKKITHGSVEPVTDTKVGTYRIRVTGLAPDDVDRARNAVSSQLQAFAVDSTGTELTATMSSTQVDTIRNTAVDQALNTIRERLDVTGVSEPRIQREGVSGDRILIQLPGVQDPEQVKRMIGQVAHLELKLVDTKGGPYLSRDAALQAYSGAIPPTLELLEGDDKSGGLQYYVVERASLITGRDLARAQPGRDEYSLPAVDFTMNALGAQKFGAATAANKGRYLAVVLDSRVFTAPVIRSKISDHGQISGSFTAEEARELSLVLQAGALPTKVQYLEERTVGPFLGKQSIDQSLFTGLVSLVLVAVVMIVYYRLSGVNAVIALLLNALLLLGSLSMLKATLTLPGIAGVILTLGMAVDANVLVFEAIRESLRAGVAPKRAVQDGFSRALSTILDANTTTILAAGALWMLGSGPVRGFGVTLFIGLVINIFTAYYVSKLLFETFVLSREFKPGETISI